MSDSTLTDAITDLAPSWSDPPGLGRALIAGSIVGVLLSFLGVTIGILALGIEWESALGLGVFVAFWGGLGFGTMVGGVVYAFGVEEAEHDRHTRVARASERARSEAGSDRSVTSAGGPALGVH